VGFKFLQDGTQIDYPGTVSRSIKWFAGQIALHTYSTYGDSTKTICGTSEGHARVQMLLLYNKVVS